MLLGAIVLLVASVLDLSWRAYQIQQAGHAVQRALPAYAVALQAGNVRGAEAAAQRLTVETDRLYNAAHDPLWRAVAAVPVLGDSFSVVTEVSTAGRGVTRDVLPTLQQAVLTLTSRSLLSHGKVDLSRVTATRPQVESAATTFRTVAGPLSHLRTTFLFGPGASLQEKVATDLPVALRGLDDLVSGLKVAPAMLGEDGPRRYFVAVQNNAESRATGGLIGAYAIVKADGGRLTRERVGTDVDLVDATSDVVDLGAEFADHYDQYGARATWSGAVMTPDFPSAARSLRGLWANLGEPPVDGVIALDAVSLAGLLGATGPITLDGRVYNGSNLAQFILKDEYVLYRDNTRRKVVLAGVAASLFDHLLTGTGSSAGVVTSLARAGSTGHLQIWSSHPAEQGLLEPLRVGGALPQDPKAFLEVLTLNASGNKADVYVTRKVAYRRHADGRATVTLTLRNSVDASEVPPIVIGRLDQHQVGGPAGTTRSIVAVYGSVGAQVRLDESTCAPDNVQSGTERMHGWASCQVEIPPGVDVVVKAEVSDPGGVLRYRQQPLARDDALDFDVPWNAG